MRRVVVAALIKKDNKILLCQRKKDDAFGLMWEFPGGAVEENETLNRAIEREIKEELNISVNAKRIVKKFLSRDILVYLIACDIKSGKFIKKECNDFGFFSYEYILKLNLAPIDKKIFNYIFKKI